MRIGDYVALTTAQRFEQLTYKNNPVRYRVVDKVQQIFTTMLVLLNEETGITITVPEWSCVPVSEGRGHCRVCGGKHPIEDMRTSMGDEGNFITVCESCLRAGTHVCPHCGETVMRWDAWWNRRDGKYYHYDCVMECRECGDYFAPDEDSTGYCPRCEEHRRPYEGQIMAYNYVPSKFFFHKTDDEITPTRYFGVELEVDKGGESSSFTEKLHNLYNKESLFYTVHDGSLRDGFEIVTHPHTLDALKTVFPWKSILEQLRGARYLSHNTNTCGLHIHINNEAFGETIDEQELRIGRLLYFMAKFKEFILAFSRRERAQLDRYARLDGDVDRITTEEGLINKVKYNKSYADKYYGINLSHHNTVEIRVFRGTLRDETLFATFEFVDKLVDMVINEDLASIQTNTLEYFIDNYFNGEYLTPYLEFVAERGTPVEPTVRDYEPTYDSVYHEIRRTAQMAEPVEVVNDGAEPVMYSARVRPTYVSAEPVFRANSSVLSDIRDVECEAPW